MISMTIRIVYCTNQIFEIFLFTLGSYFSYQGRAGRTEFWCFYLFNMVVCCGLLTFAGILRSISEMLGTLGFAVYGLYCLAILIPSIMLFIRRLHDIDKSGWFALLGFIPVFGLFIVLIFALIEGTKGANRFGDPEPISEGQFSLKLKQ